MLKQQTVATLQPALTQEMQQGLHVLQMPVQQLAAWLELQIQQNPLLENEQGLEQQDPPSSDHTPELDFDRSSFEVLQDLDESFEHALFQENNTEGKQEERHEEDVLVYKPSLFECLMQQAKEHFTTIQDLRLAEKLIGSLHENGLLPPLDEIVAREELEQSKSVLHAIQTFDPPGIAAQSIQESLLLQLKRLGKENTLAYLMLLYHFDSLSQNRLLSLQKKLKCPLQTIQRAIQKDIRPLSLSPASAFFHQRAHILMPDITIKNEETGWHIEINDEPLPSIRIKEMPKNLSEPDKQLLRPHLYSAKALVRLVEQRHKTLLKITSYLLKKQHPFLSGHTRAISPLTVQNIAYELQLHPSTINRALHDKILCCAHGLLPLRHFICQPLNHHGSHRAQEERSTDSVKKCLLQAISQENKQNPLSDDAIASLLARQGIRCARRTIAKYRSALRIPAALHRKTWP